MKKIAIYLLFSLFTITGVNSQSLNGVPISGPLPNAINAFKAKGFTFKKILDGGGAYLVGKMAGYPVELYIFTTPKSKKVHKMIIYFNKAVSWVSLKADYEKFVDLSKQKYGEPDSEDGTFINPYYEGDGYELQAVSIEKAMFYAIWLDRNNLNTMVSISRFKQVKIDYENKKLADLAKEEHEQIESGVF